MPSHLVVDNPDRPRKRVVGTKGLPSFGDLRAGLLDIHIDDLEAAFDQVRDAVAIARISDERIEAALERVEHLFRVSKAARRL